MQAFEKYRNTAAVVNGASQQLTFIFDEVTKLLHTAQNAIKAQDHQEKFRTLSRVIEVFYILKSGIDMERDDNSPEVLETFYGATIAKLEQVNTKGQDPAELQDVIDAVTEVRTVLAVQHNSDIS